MSNKYTVHAGHAAKGHLFTGAAGYCEESVEDRKIKDAVIKWLKQDGNLVADCTVDSGLSASNIIAKIKKLINAESNVKANISIHLNASKKSAKDGKVKGVECLIYPKDGVARNLGNAICKSVNALGFTNRGIKERSDLGVLKGITNSGINVLVECFFCDDQDDYMLYQKVGYDALGKAIAEGIVGHEIGAVVKSGQYVSNGVDYGKVFNPTYYSLHNSDVAKAANGDTKKLFEHFIAFGMKEGRQASADFNVQVYKERYSDLKQAFGNNLPKYYEHYCVFGANEGRKGV